MKVSDILATKGRTVHKIGQEETTITAMKTLVRHRVGALIVVNRDDEMVGILSERDIIRHAAADRAILDQPVRHVMTRDVVTGMPQDSLRSVAHTMTERRFRHLPIYDHGQLIGIVSIGDILKHERDLYRGEIDTLETRLLADDP